MLLALIWLGEPIPEYSDADNLILPILLTLRMSSA